VVQSVAERIPDPASARSIDRDLWAMAWPAMLSFVVVNIVDVVDVWLIGHLGRQTMAAWGYASQCLNLIETLLLSVGIGCVALMARAVGADDGPRARRVLAASVLASQAVAGVGLLLALLVPRQILRLLDAAPEVIEIAVPFFRLLAASMLAYGAAYAFESGLRANKNTRAPMAVAVVVMLVKAVLSVVLIFGYLGAPRLGLTGAGMATLGAHLVGLTLYVAISRRFARQGLHVTFDGADLRAALSRTKPGSEASAVTEVARVSLPSMAERLVMSLAILTYFKILSGYGTAAIAAYAIGVRLLSLSWIPGLAFGAAASAFVGQALGAGDSAQARRVGFRAIGQVLIVMCIMAVGVLFLREPLARAFTSDDAVAADLAPMMLMLGVAQPFMGTHFALGGVLRGAGDTMTPFLGAALGNLCFRVPLAWVFARLLGMPLAWVWSALVFDHIARLAVNGTVFMRGGWSQRVGATVNARSAPEPP
jgi:putative MATE family efflux protein